MTAPGTAAPSKSSRRRLDLHDFGAMDVRVVATRVVQGVLSDDRRPLSIEGVLPALECGYLDAGYLAPPRGLAAVFPEPAVAGRGDADVEQPLVGVEAAVHLGCSPRLGAAGHEAAPVGSPSRASIQLAIVCPLTSIPCSEYRRLEMVPKDSPEALRPLRIASRSPPTMRSAIRYREESIATTAVVFAQRITVNPYEWYCQDFVSTGTVDDMAALPEPHSDPRIIARRAIAEEVLALMGRHRTSQKTLATYLGMSQPALSKRLAGFQPFDADELLDVAAFFEVDVTALLVGVRTGSFSSLLTALPEPTGQGQLLDDELSPFEFFARPALASV